MKTKYQNSDFNKLMINVYDVPKSIDLNEEFPIFKDYPEYSLPLPKDLEKNRNHIIRYIVYVYDKGSPLKIMFQDLNNRKMEAAQLSGFRVNDKGRFKIELENVFRGYNPEVNAMIIRYCRSLNDMDYSYLIAAREDYYHIMHEAMNRSENEDSDSINRRKRLFDSAKKRKDEIQELSESILARDNSKELNLDLFRVIDHEQKITLKLSPEKRNLKKK